MAALTLVTVALFSRYMRSSMLENLVQDYVRTAKAKGVSDRAILFKHVMRNALIPVITLIGLSLPGIIAGAVVTEFVFNYPGMGLLFIQAAEGDDFPILARGDGFGGHRYSVRIIDRGHPLCSR